MRRPDRSRVPESVAPHISGTFVPQNSQAPRVAVPGHPEDLAYHSISCLRERPTAGLASGGRGSASATAEFRPPGLRRRGSLTSASGSPGGSNRPGSLNMAARRRRPAATRRCRKSGRSVCSVTISSPIVSMLSGAARRDQLQFLHRDHGIPVTSYAIGLGPSRDRSSGRTSPSARATPRWLRPWWLGGLVMKSLRKLI